MLPALLVLTLVFVLLFLTRLGAAYRALLLRRWPVVALALAALFALIRGAIAPALVLSALAAAAWFVWPAIERWAAPKATVQRKDSPEESAARVLLGVGPSATADEIRRAYRAKMARAHPDRGGSHNEAARLAAARDCLLKQKR